MTGGKYFLETFGCQMNILDSQLVEGQLRARGLAPTADYRQADLILFNTCSVRQHAEDKVHSRLGQLRGHKRRKPDTIIGVIGCMAEREKEGLFVKSPHVDLLCGPGELNQLPALLDELAEQREQVTALAGSISRRTEVLQRALEYDSLEALDLSRAPEIEGDVLQSYIRVQRGCDKFCTYCVVPFTRGPERSRPPAHILDEASTLAARGCREITLLGQTVNSYVHQQDGAPVPFARLLEMLHDVDGLDRIRFVTSFPADWDEDIFRVMRDYPRIMPYLHIPAQSGSDRILEKMKRTYTADSYRKLMDTARKYIPDIALAGDFIVGFCTETEAEFQQSIDLVRDVDYASLFVFKYSPRPGTKADRNMPDDIAEDEKNRRCNELLAVQKKISARHRADRVGQTVEVLVEGYSKIARKQLGATKGEMRTRGKSSPAFPARKRDFDRRRDHEQMRDTAPYGADTAEPGPDAESWQPSEQDRGAEVSKTATSQLVGRTPHDMIVVFDAPPRYIGGIVNIHVESATAHTLFGRVMEVVSPPRPAQPPAATPNTPGGLPILHQ